MSVSFYPARKKRSLDNLSQTIVPADDWKTCVNVSNTNASMLLKLIGIDDYELTGEISITECRKIAELVDNVDLTSPYSESRGEKGCKIIDMGISLDQLKGYAHHFEWLADEAEKMEAHFIAYA